jgi:hypothetical protein
MIRGICVALVLVALPAAAQEEESGRFLFGGDAYMAGADVIMDARDVDDAFAAGERVELAAPVGGSAHLAGRRVTVGAEVGGELYAAGGDVSVAAPVAGGASLAGYDLTVGAAIGGNLRAAGANVAIDADVAGSALIAGGSVTIDGVISGDASIEADEIAFGPDARVDGELVLETREAAPAVPAEVASADRVERRTLPSDEARGWERENWMALAIGYLVGILVLALLATLAAAIAPAGMERLRAIIDERPFRTFGVGFLALSVLVGASVLLVMTLIGILAVPVLILLAMVLGFLGYIAMVYLVGRAVWNWLDRFPPDTFGERFLAALIGAVAVSLVALVPFFGWIAIPLLTLTGMGAITVAWFRPEFRSDA